MLSFPLISLNSSKPAKGDVFNNLHAHVHTGSEFSLFSLFYRLWLFFVHSHPSPSFPPSSLSSPLLTSLLSHLAPFEVRDSSKSNKIFSSSFSSLWTARENRKLRNRGPCWITAVNQKPALTSLPWSEKSVRAALWKVHRPVWRYIALSTSAHTHKKQKQKKIRLKIHSQSTAFS